MSPSQFVSESWPGLLRHSYAGNQMEAASMMQNSTILIVDDEAGVRETLELLLMGEGYNLVFAGDGTEALAKATELTPDLILLDVMMPDMDGFEVCRRLRADPLLAGVPIIMVTALDDRDSRLQGIEAGADNFISKPFDRTELLAHVRTITRLNRYRQLLLANQQLENRIAQLSALYDISRALNYIVDIDTQLELIVRQAKELLSVERASIMFHDQEKDELYFPVVAVEGDEIEKRLMEIHFPADRGIAGWVFREGEPALVQDVNIDERFSGEIDEKTGFVTKSVLCVPLCGRKRMLGVLEVVNNKKEGFTEDDQQMLEAMADNIAVSIERANLYQDLQNSYTELKEMQQQLVQSEKLSALGGLSAGIAHEVKNPLAIILTGIEILQMKLSEADADVKAIMEKVKEATLRANAVLKNLLRFSRPSDMKIERVKAGDLIENAISFFEYKASLKNIEIQTRLSDEEACLEIDNLQIQQVLLNILMNSVEAMPEDGKIEVKGYGTTLPDGGVRYMIEITDTGEGISEDDLSRIFEAFYTTKRDNDGTGLGLHISKMIMENHGGDLAVQSELGKGTRVRLALPLASGGVVWRE